MTIDTRPDALDAAANHDAPRAQLPPSLAAQLHKWAEDYAHAAGTGPRAALALRDYKRAIKAQEVVGAMYKESAEAPDAMLNIASSYAELKDRSAARKTLQQLIKNFPTSSAARAAKDRLAVLK